MNNESKITNKINRECRCAPSDSDAMYVSSGSHLGSPVQEMPLMGRKILPSSKFRTSGTTTRVITGAVYFVGSTACILINEYTLLFLLAITAAFAAGEFYYMLRQDSKLPNELIGILGAASYPISVWYFGMIGAVYVTLALLISLLVWYVFWRRARISDVAVSLFGAAYTGLLLSPLLTLYDALPGNWGSILVFGIYGAVWLNDVFAYAIGSKIGKHKLAPAISPQKSVEGFIAGLCLSVLIWCVISFLPGLQLPIWQAVIYGIVCGLAAVLGDLAESRIKRNSGFKDSGTIMPGHGGVLDRTDSIFLAAAVASTLLIIGGNVPYALL